MKKIIQILIALSISLMFFSCKDSFLETKPLGDYSEVDVWNDPALVETFVNSMYRNALGFPFSIDPLSNYVDESLFTPDWGVSNFNKSLMTPDDLMGWAWNWDNDHSPDPQSYHYQWKPLYQNVRRANVFFSKINNVPGDKAKIDNLKGQAYFMRAWTYFYLTNLYGGVPIVNKVYGLTDDFKVPRNTYDECITYIVSQLDSAALTLPKTSADGHVTIGAALALKARVLLYAASDLHNSAKNSAVTTGYTKPELLGYVGGDATARWTAAKNAAKAVIDLGTYSLYKANPAPTDPISANLVEFFTSKSPTSEDILLQFFSAKTDENWAGYNPAIYCGPNGYHNWGNTTPLGDLVDEYEMTDGSSFDWNNPAQKSNPYINRDARLYSTVLYEGVQWRKRPDDVLAIDPYSKIQVGHVYSSTATDPIVSGLDTREGPIENWNGGKSGYYLRKFVDASVDPQYVKQIVPYKHLRYGEVLLNYAEACIELGGGANEAEARQYINMIRTRAGQPNLLPTLSGDALRQAYRHERRIELAFEEHRFWDVRRWLIADKAYYQTHRVDVRYVTSEAATRYRKADGSTWGDPIFNKREIDGDSRAWDKKSYFFPILRDEMNKNDLLIQNPGY